MLNLLLPVIAGYLLGSIPFGLLLTRAFGYGDIRTIGSGNIGATNVLRTGNKWLAAATLLLDGLKGTFAVLIGQYFMTFDAGMAAGAGAVVGHMFPVWLKFKGGKGVATSLGVIIGIFPPVGLLTCLLWIITAAALRFSSLAALTAIGFSPVIAWFFSKDFTGQRELPDGSTIYFFNHHLNFLPYLCAVMAALVFYKHRENIERLRNGTEPKIGSKKKTDASAA